MAKLLIAIGGYILSKFVLKLMTALGLAFLTYKGLDALVSRAVDALEPLLSGLPARILNLMALSGWFEALSVICSAMLTAAAIASARAWLGAAK